MPWKCLLGCVEKEEYALSTAAGHFDRLREKKGGGLGERVGWLERGLKEMSPAYSKGQAIYGNRNF